MDERQLRNKYRREVVDKYIHKKLYVPIANKDIQKNLKGIDNEYLEIILILNV